MNRRLLALTLSVAALGLTVGCLYPERWERREERSERRHDRGREEGRGREHDRDHDREHGERRDGLSQPGLAR